MQITINGNQVTFTLQQEQNAGEVLKSLHTWLSTEGWGIQSIFINNENILYAWGWNTKALEDVTSIAIEASPLKDLRLASLNAIAAWAGHMHGVMDAVSKRQAGISELLSALGLYGELEGALGFLCEYDPAPHRLLDSQTRKSLDSHVAHCTRDDGSFNADELPDFALTVYNVLVVSKDRIREIEDPLGELRKTSFLAQSLLGDMSETGTLLQTGKEKEAYTRIFTMTEILGKVLRLFWLVEGNTVQNLGLDLGALQAWNTKGTAILEQIRESMDAHDTIMLGDVLEYELAPAIEELLGLIPQGESQ